MLRYNEYMLNTEPNGVMHLAKSLFVQLQWSSFLDTKLTTRELKDYDKQVAQLLSAPRGAIPEC